MQLAGFLCRLFLLLPKDYPSWVQEYILGVMEVHAMSNLRAPDWLLQFFVERSEAEPSWHRKPLSVGALYVFIGFLAYWEIHVPSPGKAVTALAVAAAAMSIRGEMGGKEKVAWMLLLFAFLSLELTSIDTERRASEEMQSQIRWQEAEHFKKIGHDINYGLQDVVTQSEKQFRQTVQQQSKQFAATMKIEQQNVNQITGGKSYAVVLPDTTDSTVDVLPIGIVMCDTCEESIVASVYVQEAELAGPGTGTLTFKGQVNPHSMFMIGKISGLRGKEKSYKITVFARNKPTFEILRIRFNQEKKHWQFSYSITREEKQAHFNPKTQMAEGEVFTILVKETVWDEFKATPQNPSTVTVH
jgi:hypothetical protein